MIISERRLSAALAFLFYAAMMGGPALAQTAAPPEAARCLGCHGIEGLKLGDPPISVPMLGRQNPAYMVRALKAYRDGKRKNGVMALQVVDLSDTQIAALSQWLGGPRESPPPEPDFEVPRLVNEVCGACHGPTGYGGFPEIPVLTGQHADYLLHALNEYRNGNRDHPIMPYYAKALSEAEMRELAAYFDARIALKVPK